MFRFNLKVNIIGLGTENYLHVFHSFVYWAQRCVQRKPRSDRHVVFQYYTNIILDGLKSK